MPSAPRVDRAGSPVTLAVLRANVSRANAEYALKYMLRAGAPLDAAAGRLLKRLPTLPVPKDLLTAKAMTDWVVAQCKTYEPKAAEAAGAYLGQNLKSVRNGAEVEWRFGVEQVTALEGSALASGQVFDAARVVDRFQADAQQHTMHDLGSYMNEWLPSFVVADLGLANRELWVMEGDRDGAIARAAADGYTRAYHLGTPGAFDANELYLAENPTTGARRYFFAEVQGDSGIATLLRVAGMSKQAAPVSVVTQVATRKNSELIASYQQLQPFAKATKTIIGFKNTVLTELWKRKVLGEAELDLRWWAERHGVDAGPKATRIGRLPDADSTRALQALAVANAAAGMQEAKKLLERLETPALARAVAHTPGIEPWDGALLTVKNSAGQERSLALLRTPYGESAGAFVETLKGLGTRELGVIGTAGGLEMDSEVGTIYVPTSVREDGTAQGPRAFSNALSPVLSDGGARAIRERAQGVSVLTPLDETWPTVKGMRLAGDDFVELELGAMTEAAKGLTFASAFVVSDVPGSTQTIESQAPNALDASVAKVVDGLLKTLDVADVVVPRTAASPKLVERGLVDVDRRGLLGALGNEVGLTGLKLHRFVEAQAKALADVPPGQLAVPPKLLLERGKALQRELVQALVTEHFASPWPTSTLMAMGTQPGHEGYSPVAQYVVPGTRAELASPARVLELDASPIDALALELAKLDEQRHQPPERRSR